MRTWSRRLLALSGGAALASLIASFLGGSNHPWFELAMPLLIGNLMIAALLSVILCWHSRTPDTAWGKLTLVICLLPSLGAFGLSPMILAICAVVFIGIFIFKCTFIPRVSHRANLFVLGLATAAAFGGGYKNHLHLKEMIGALVTPPLAKSPITELEAPDVILISLDTLRSDAIVGERSPSYELPFFDGMRQSGQWWDYAYSSSNQTLPGHASMLSGQDALASGVRYNFNQLPGPDHLHLVSEYFKNSGYQTAGVISNALIAGDMGFNRSFDLYDDSTTPRFGPRTACLNYLSKSSWLGISLPGKVVSSLLSSTSFGVLRRPPRGMGDYTMRERGMVTNEQAVNALEQLYSSEQPFFFFLHYIDVHHPYGAPAPYQGQLTAGMPPLAQRYQPSEKLDGMITLEQLDKIRADLGSDNKELHDSAVAAADYYQQLYLENLLFLDSRLEEIRHYVEQSERPTLWLITADHGEHFAENDAMLHGNHMFQDSIRVPFIISGPGISSNKHRAGIPDLADVTPTLLDYAGIEIPQQMNGRSLIGNHDLAPKLHVVTDDKRLMLRMQNHKLIAERQGDDIVATHVFDLESDPLELNNLLGEADIQNELLDVLLEELQRDTFVGGSSALSAEQNAALDELGYVDSHDEH
jgi:arylsulfatase A-like enzyme